MFFPGCCFLLLSAKFTQAHHPNEPSKQESKSALLIAAAQDGEHESISDLLAAGSDPEEADGCLRTPLLWAAMNGNARCVEALLRGGADAAAVDECRRSALIWAALNGHDGCLRLLCGVGSSSLLCVTPCLVPHL